MPSSPTGFTTKQKFNGGLVHRNAASAPGSPEEGEAYWNTTAKALEIFDGTSFLTIGPGGGGVNVTGLTGLFTTFNFNTNLTPTDAGSGVCQVDASGGGGTPNHNDTLSIQGGTGGEYFHFTSAQHTNLLALLGGGDTSLHVHDIYTLADGTRPFTGNQSFGGNEIVDFLVENLASDPTFTMDDEGRVIWRTDLKKFRKNDGTQWDDLIPPGGGSIPIASDSEDGLMSMEDRIKLDSIEAMARTYPVFGATLEYSIIPDLLDITGLLEGRTLTDTTQNLTFATAATRDLDITLGDDAGGTKISVKDSGGAEVALINSNGTISGTAIFGSSATLSGNIQLTAGGSIVTTADGDITLSPDGTGIVVTTKDLSIPNLTASGDITLTAGGTITTTSNGNITLAPNGTGSIQTSALIQASVGTELRLWAQPGENAEIRMGDAAGATKFSWKDSGGAEQGSYNSDGLLKIISLDSLGGSGTGIKVLDILEANAASVLRLKAASGQNVDVTLGDAAGSQVLNIKDSGGTVQGTWDSDGKLSTVGLSSLSGDLVLHSQLISATGTALRLKALAGQNIELTMGDTGGVQTTAWKDSAGATVSDLNSDGTLRIVGLNSLGGSGLTLLDELISGAGTAARLTAATGQNVDVKVGDQSGVNFFRVLDSTGAVVSTINSNGAGTFNGIALFGSSSISVSGAGGGIISSTGVNVTINPGTGGVIQARKNINLDASSITTTGNEDLNLSPGGLGLVLANRPLQTTGGHDITSTGDVRATGDIELIGGTGNITSSSGGNVNIAPDGAGLAQYNGVELVVTTDSRLSDARTPTGAASGGLSGTYPSPSVNGMTGGVLSNDTAHGSRGGGSQHSLATTSVNGFMSASDKTKLDGFGTDQGKSLVSAKGAGGLSTSTALIPFTTEEWDIDGDFAGSTFTAPAAGKYLVTALFALLATNSGGTTIDATFNLEKNAAAFKTWKWEQSPGVAGWSIWREARSMTIVVDLAASDTIRWTGSRTVASTSVTLEAESYFQVTRLG